MNSRQKMVQQSFLDDEAGILRLLYRSYSEALEGIKAGIEEKYEAIAKLTEEINDLPPNDPKRVVLEGRRMANVYQEQYQESLERQVSGILGDMDAKNYANVTDYLEGCYDNGFLGAMYDIHGQGIPLTLPINQQKAVHAVQTDSKISEGLYRRLGKDTADLKRKITSQVSRSMITGESYGQCAQALERQTEIGFNRAARIARTEGHRIQVTAAMDALYDAREAGADVVKQWDATLDKRTRRSHARCDGEIREIDDTFGNGLMCPGDPKGPASEVVNCRCALLQRARWGLDDDELATLKERAAYFGLDKADSFEEFKERYRTITGVVFGSPITGSIRPHSGAKRYQTQHPELETDDLNYDNLLTRLELSGIEFNPVRNLAKPETEAETIKALAGYDIHGRSCMSLSLAYIGRRNGLDVLDFRGGESADFFSIGLNADRLSCATGFKTIKANGRSSVEVGENLIGQCEAGKDYLLAVGKHASIIRKTGNGSIQYLELQSADFLGWREFDSDLKKELEFRFFCTQYYDNGISEMLGFMVDLQESDFANDEFRAILGYLNTAIRG